MPQMIFSCLGRQPIPVLGSIHDDEGIDFGKVAGDSVEHLLTLEEAAELYHLDPRHVRQIYIDIVAPWITITKAASLGITESELDASRPPPQSRGTHPRRSVQAPAATP